MIQCEIIGDIVRRDPDTNGHVRFTVACPERRREESEGSRRSVPILFHVIFRRNAIAGRLVTGVKVFVRGRLTARITTGADGGPRLWSGIRATEVRLCSDPPEESGADGPECGGETAGFSPMAPEKAPGPDSGADADRSARERFRDFFCGRRHRTLPHG